MDIYCPRCGHLLAEENGQLVCRPGDMPLSEHMREQLTAYVVAPPRARVGRSSWSVRIGGRWFCPACGVETAEREGRVECRHCGGAIQDLLRALIELHPHRDTDAG
jgi:uncharacterized Zn finger protein (UPF0148 family)